MHDADIDEGKFPTKWGMNTGRPSNGGLLSFLVNSSSLMSFSDQFSVGAFADSAHEYLLKQWLMTSGSESKARDLCRSPF